MQVGLRQQGWTWGAACADLNGDSFLDVYASTVIPIIPAVFDSALFMNQAGEVFTEDRVSWGLDIDLHCLRNHLWFDWGDDGDLDLFVGTYVSSLGISAEEIDRIYENDGTGHFTWASGAINSSPEATRGVYLADFDGNGVLDILALQQVRPNATNPPPVLNNVWSDNGDGTFTDIAPRLNLGIPGHVIPGGPRDEKRMAVVADFDSDMDPDVYVATWNARIGGEPPDYLFLNEGGVYVDRSAQAGITLGLNTYACAAADVNGDGFLDIYAVNDNDFGTRDTLYLNNGNSNHWIEIDPRGVISNRDAIGLKAWLTAGGVTQVQELYSTTTLPSLLHFGLGPNTAVDELVLRWPRGLVETYTDLPADQVFRPVEGAATPFDGTGLLLR